MRRARSWAAHFQLLAGSATAKVLGEESPSLYGAWFMLTALVLTMLAIGFRVFSADFEVWNLVPMGAIALYAGSRLPRRWAWVVPVVAMVLSDLILDHGRYRPLFELSRWTIYTTFAAVSFLGPIANRPRIGRWLLPGLALSGSLIFFLTSNFATWAEGLLYPMTTQGLWLCYYMAWPFFKNTVTADLVGTAVLFSVGPVCEYAWYLLTHRPRPAEIPVEAGPSAASRPAPLS